MFAGFLSVPLLPSLIPSTPVSWRHTEKHRLFEEKIEAKRSYTKAALAFSIASLLIGVFAVLDACLSPVTWQHCHGDRGLSNHLCNDPYSPEGRRRDGGAEGGGGWNESRASKAEEGREGGEQQSKAAGTQTETKRKKKTYFLSTGSRERNSLCFHITNTTLSKRSNRGTQVREKVGFSRPNG